MADEGDLDFFRRLESADFQVEVRPVARKRPREVVEVDAEPAVDVSFEAPDASDDDDSVRVILCDGGPRSGGLSYYLGRHWERQDEENGTLALVSGPDQPEERDEAMEETLAKIIFQMDEDELADTPWRRAGANLSDFFNFSLSEEEFKEYVMRSGVRIRLEARRQRREGRA
ncbi:unnamed protein product [Effrenium voratum]|nr:unnamed protein product [Effrenium voratum]